jgi:hypothetical protein
MKKDDKYAVLAMGTFHGIMDKMENGHYKNVYFITTTNDWAGIQRDNPTMKSRFTKRVGEVISMGNPSEESRKAVLEQECEMEHIKIKPEEIDKIVKETEGKNMADLQCIVKKIRDKVDKEQAKIVKQFQKNFFTKIAKES